jgi:hypothetical protein
MPEVRRRSRQVREARNCHGCDGEKKGTSGSAGPIGASSHRNCNSMSYCGAAVVLGIRPRACSQAIRRLRKRTLFDLHAVPGCQR